MIYHISAAILIMLLASCKEADKKKETISQTKDVNLKAFEAPTPGTHLTISDSNFGEIIHSNITLNEEFPESKASLLFNWNSMKDITEIEVGDFGVYYGELSNSYFFQTPPKLGNKQKNKIRISQRICQRIFEGTDGSGGVVPSIDLPKESCSKWTFLPYEGNRFKIDFPKNAWELSMNDSLKKKVSKVKAKNGPNKNYMLSVSSVFFKFDFETNKKVFKINMQYGD